MKHLLLILGCLSAARTTQALAPTFAPIVYYATSEYNVALADVNGDGKLDILADNGYQSTVGVLLGNGDGTFQPIVNYSMGAARSAALDLVVADVNGDGRLDIVLANDSYSTAGVLLGNGNGTFQPVVAYSTGYGRGVFGVALADVNGDNRVDLLAASGAQTGAGVLLGNGDGTFQPVVLYDTGPSTFSYEVAVADFNQDGKRDLLTASNGIGDGKGLGACLLLGNGDGTFQPVRPQPVIDFYPFAPTTVVTADFNADGKADYALGDINRKATLVYLGKGDGTFQPAHLYTGAAYKLTVADVNRDRKLDLLTASERGAGILLGNGDGTFQAAVYYSEAYWKIAAGDVNGDGRPDLVTATLLHGIGVLLNTTPLATLTTLPGVTVSLAPNPATSSAALRLAGLPALVTHVQATLLDATGRVVRQQTVLTGQGSTQAELSTGGLAAGLYVLRLAAADAQDQPVGDLPTQRLSVL